MLRIKITSPFKRDLKRLKHNQPVINALDQVLKMLVIMKELPPKYQDHNLTNDWKGYRECHVKPDLLLIYHVNTKEKLLTLERLASHSELFK